MPYMFVVLVIAGLALVGMFIRMTSDRDEIERLDDRIEALECYLRQDSRTQSMLGDHRQFSCAHQVREKIAIIERSRPEGDPT